MDIVLVGREAKEGKGRRCYEDRKRLEVEVMGGGE